MFRGVFMKSKYPYSKIKITVHHDKFAGFTNKAPEANELPMPPSHWSN